MNGGEFEMTRRELLIGAVGLSLASGLQTAQVNGDESIEDLGPTLESIRGRFGIPGMGAIVVSRNRIIAEGTCGFRRASETGLIPPDAHWQIGSITKTFTATLAAILVERKKLTWDTPLREIYPEQTARMAPDVAGITIRQLVRHQSGFGGDVVPWAGVPETNQPGLTLSQRRQRMAILALKSRLRFVPGSKTEYSNQGYNLLGAALERVGQRSWEELIIDEIAKPLGMRSLVFGEPALRAPDREPWPHLHEGKSWKPVPAVPFEMYGYHLCNPAGGISLTLAQAARWMQAHLNESAILSRESFKTIHTPESKGGVPAFAIGSQGHSFGRSFSHAGSNGRNFADLMLLPDHGVGVFMAINAVPPENQHAHWMVWNTLISKALKGNWPRPALTAPEPKPDGTIEGEAMVVLRLNGGSVDFQNFEQLSGKFQLWWSGAHDGNQLVLRLKVSRTARYLVEGVFARNADFGDVTIKLGSIQKHVKFRSERLEWERMTLGETSLTEGQHDLTVTAHGNAGQGGIVCHLGLDVLKLKNIEN